MRWSKLEKRNRRLSRCYRDRTRLHSAIKLAVADPNADLSRGDMTADEMREIIRRKLIEEGLLPPPVEH